MSKSNAPKKRLAIIVVVAALVLGGGGAALAWWSATGSMTTSTAAAASSTPFLVESAGTDGTALSPGGAGETVMFTVTNPGTGTQKLSAVTVTVNVDGADVAGAPGCLAADYTVSTPTITTGAMVAGAKVSGSVVITMENTSENQDACQGIQVPLTFVAS